MRISYRLFRFLLLLALSCTVSQTFQTHESKPAPPAQTEKAEGIIKQGIEALGGSAYLSVQNVVGRGFFTAYQDGASQLPTRFLDYIVYPDKERTEFTSGGVRVIQTNTGATGWLYDGATKSLHDQKPAQIEDFKRSMRTSIDNPLRGWWRNEGATLSYAGRREAGLAKRNETVRITYPDGFWIEYGLIIEVHPCPERALSDGPQSLDLPGFAELMKGLGIEYPRVVKAA